MANLKSRPWREIAETYREFVEDNWDMQPMLGLVDEIAASRYAEGSYATSSMATLCVAQTAEFELDRNMLRVDFKRGRFTFRYLESPYKGTAWQKECGRDEGFSTFEHVVDRLKWYLT